MPQPSVPTVLITGSSGFLGQSIARGLLDRYRIIGLDLTQPKKPVAGVETIEINLTSDDDVAPAMAEVRQRVGNRIASVIHLAAYYDTPVSSDDRRVGKEGISTCRSRWSPDH